MWLWCKWKRWGFLLLVSVCICASVCTKPLLTNYRNERDEKGCREGWNSPVWGVCTYSFLGVSWVPCMEVHACSHHGNIWLLVLWDPRLLCKVSEYFLQLFLVLFLVWCLSIVIDGHDSSDWLLGPMLVKVCCVLCLGLVWVSWMGWHCVSSLSCVCVAHDVCIILRSS